MAKLSAWIITIVGVVMALGLLGLGFDWSTMWVQWVLTVLVLALGISKLVRNYSNKKK